MRRARALTVALLLVGAGRLLSPAAVPVYDGIGAPDEPYRYVAPPAGAPRTAPPTSASASSPLAGGRSQAGLALATGESGPQLSLFVPPQALAAAGSTVTVTAEPLAPKDQPTGATIDGNVYDVRFTAAGPVRLTDQASLATLYLRATGARQPGPVMEHRAATGQPWQQLRTARGGQDFYVSAFPGPGQYALAFLHGGASSHGGSSPLPWVLVGGIVLLLVVVVVVRLRAGT